MRFIIIIFLMKTTGLPIIYARKLRYPDIRIGENDLQTLYAKFGRQAIKHESLKTIRNYKLERLAASRYLHENPNNRVNTETQPNKNPTLSQLKDGLSRTKRHFSFKDERGHHVQTPKKLFLKVYKCDQSPHEKNLSIIIKSTFKSTRTSTKKLNKPKGNTS